MKKIIILGSTGSIGKQTLEIIKKDNKKFKIVLLSTDKNNCLALDSSSIVFLFLPRLPRVQMRSPSYSCSPSPGLLILIHF